MQLQMEPNMHDKIIHVYTDGGIRPGHQHTCSETKTAYHDTPLYLAPGAQPAPSVRPAALYPVISWLRNGCDPMEAANELEMLTAAQEAKP